MKQKKEGFLQNIINKFKKYNESSILLSLLSTSFSNLKKEIIAKSSDNSKKEEYTHNVLTPEQIEKARKHSTGFVKLAIQTIAKRQSLLNDLDKKKQNLSALINELEYNIITVIRISDENTDQTFENMKKFLKKLKEYHDKIRSIEKQTQKQVIIIDKLISKHSREWNEHSKNYTNKLIQELQQQNIILSELEKKELLSPTKTIEEINQNIEKSNKKK